MAEPFVAEIRIFPFTFPPKGWAFCNGQLMPISQNTALFSLLGTYYGGDGKSTFALPSLQGCAVMHPGQGAGLSEHFLGEKAGSQTVTLLESEIPAHSHSLNGINQSGLLDVPTNNALARNSFYNNAGGQPLVPMSAQAIPPAGGSQPHNNMQPYLTLNFNIALQGVFPQRP